MSEAEELPICAVILAAGNSRRFGSENKLLTEVEGVSIIERVVRSIGACKPDRTVVVLDKNGEKIESSIRGYDLEFAINERSEEGMGTSIARGVREVDPNCFSGILLCLGDLPFLGNDVGSKVVEAFRRNRGERIVVPRHGDLRGHPVVFPISFRPQLLDLEGDRGAKDIMRGERSLVEVSVDLPGIARDVDTKSDLPGIRMP